MTISDQSAHAPARRSRGRRHWRDMQRPPEPIGRLEPTQSLSYQYLLVEEATQTTPLSPAAATITFSCRFVERYRHNTRFERWEIPQPRLNGPGSHSPPAAAVNRHLIHWKRQPSDLKPAPASMLQGHSLRPAAGARSIRASACKDAPVGLGCVAAGTVVGSGLNALSVEDE
jgi:hypothetical protein